MQSRHRPRLVLFLAAFATLALLSAACSDSDDNGSGTEPTTEADEGNDADAGPPESGEAGITVHAKDIAFDETTLEATAGTVEMSMVNDGQIPHTLVIEGREDDLKLEVNKSGDEDSGSIDLEPGEYAYYCDVPGHRDAGMEGTLTVT